MSLLPGDKAKLITTLDNMAADDLSSHYTIEVVLSKSPKQGVKCGAIVVFQQNDVDLNMTGSLDSQVAFEVEKEIREKTDRPCRDAEYFKESEGRWIGWARRRVVEIFSELNNNADVKIKCPKLGVVAIIERKDMVHFKKKENLFKVLREIDRLLDKGFEFDAWSGTIRRGEINAKKGKR